MLPLSRGIFAKREPPKLDELLPALPSPPKSSSSKPVREEPDSLSKDPVILESLGLSPFIVSLNPPDPRVALEGGLSSSGDTLDGKTPVLLPEKPSRPREELGKKAPVELEVGDPPKV